MIAVKLSRKEIVKMSERLEEIKNKTEQYCWYTHQIVTIDDVEWLIEQAEKVVCNMCEEKQKQNYVWHGKTDKEILCNYCDGKAEELEKTLKEINDLIEYKEYSDIEILEQIHCLTYKFFTNSK
jgi:hypothetical protein